MSGYPSSQPAWQQQELNQLSAAGDLSGINPLVLAGIEQNESGFENAGAGINSSGYGGYYGLGENSSYSFNGQTYQESPSILSSNSSISYAQQSEAAAAEVAHLLQGTGNLQAALAEYTGGGPTNGDYELAMADLGGASPTLSGASYPATGAGGTTPTASGGGSTNATTTAFGGSLNPANWPSEVITAIGPWVARIILVIVGLILLKVGFDKLLDTDASPAAIITQAPQSVGGSPSPASKGMQGPGAPQRDSGGGTESESDHEEPPKHDVADAAEDGAEVAAA